MGLILSVLLCFACGFFLAGIGLPRIARSGSALFLQISLGVGYGLGVVSLAFLLSRAAGGVNPLKLEAAACALVLAAYVAARKKENSSLFLNSAAGETPQWLSRMMIAACAIALVCALYAATMRVLAHPHGDGWDAFAIWNLHARFLFFNGANWHEGFSPLIAWSHPDYPLLLPGAIANFWIFMGRDSTAVPVLIAILFTFGTVGVLYSSLNLLRGQIAALLAATALLATPAFVEVGTAQYADIPLSFFFLGTAALLCIAEERARAKAGPLPMTTLALAGVGCSFAVWTKNEGLLFLSAIVVARLLIFIERRKETKAAGRLVPFIVGALPILILVMYFKRVIAPPSELFANSPSTIHKLLTPARYWAVAQWFLKEFFRFGEWLVLPISLLLVLYYFVARLNKDGELRNAVPRDQQSFQLRVLRIALLLTLAGYAFIYVITPYEIYWHLRFSLNRLFLQLWPSTIFLFCMGVFGGRNWCPQLTSVE